MTSYFLGTEGVGFGAWTAGIGMRRVLVGSPLSSQITDGVGFGVALSVITLILLIAGSIDCQASAVLAA